MSYFIDICFICLKHCNNLVRITSQDTNGTNFEDKLKYFLPGLELKSNIPKYICAKCGKNLNKIREFKQICLRNITTYEKYAQQITTTDSSYKYLSVSIRPDFVYENDINIEELQTEMNVDIKIEEIIKEETKVLEEEVQSLRLEIKEEKFELDDTYKTEYIEETVQVSNDSVSLLAENRVIVEQSDKNYYCEICNKSFHPVANFRRHKLIHTGEKPHTCKVCNKSFRHSYNLIRHKLIHSSKPYSCELCKKLFECQEALQQHKPLHTNEKPFTCEVCEKSFRRLAYLKSHKLVHTGEKPFTCKVCNKSFRYSQTFNCHKFTHTDEKPYTCEVCNKSFGYSRTLKDHKVTHTNEACK